MTPASSLQSDAAARDAAAPAADANTTYLSPRQVATMWRTSHDKILAFIKTGELQAFNVASGTSGRPRYRITLASVKDFESRRAGREPSHAPSVSRSRRATRSVSEHAVKKYF
jgi:hypothetical protein